MQARLTIAMGIGLLISSIFMAIPSLRDGTSSWASLELPGMTAAFIFWGMGGNSVILALALSWAVNAVVYGLGALAILSIFKISN